MAPPNRCRRYEAASRRRSCPAGAGRERSPGSRSSSRPCGATAPRPRPGTLRDAAAVEVESRPREPEHAGRDRATRHARDSLELRQHAGLVQPPQRAGVEEHRPVAATRQAEGVPGSAVAAIHSRPPQDRRPSRSSLLPCRALPSSHVFAPEVECPRGRRSSWVVTPLWVDRSCGIGLADAEPLIGALREASAETRLALFRR